ncbi:PA4642 family protein [Reinekea marina]|uniref:PA4642 family protein n=1 Tax=Reinekea marina TaxID=1310421 RepID=A0ABV7WRR8_9GAMM|nr:PA4642 family protein [Reinekea marina]MBU2863908.1 PA4642 family protein [Reinekea forsetii]MDN3648222.1 PA4642 family protein [Reinekea marina]
MKKDKKRIEDEQWSEEQLQDYLNFQPLDDTDVDFQCLYRAYTRMNADVFEVFVDRFIEAGRNVNAQNKQGQSLADIIADHKKGAPYLQALTH